MSEDLRRVGHIQYEIKQDAFPDELWVMLQFLEPFIESHRASPFLHTRALFSVGVLGMVMGGHPSGPHRVTLPNPRRIRFRRKQSGVRRIAGRVPNLPRFRVCPASGGGAAGTQP